MARRKTKRTSNKIVPSPQKLWFAMDTWDGNTQASANHYVDLSQSAGIASRRFLRQGLNWAVAKITLHVPELLAGESWKVRQFSVSKLHNTWVQAQAWKHAFRAWQRMNKEALSESDDAVKGRFLDFKIYADQIHHEKGFAANLIPVGFYPGEWIASTVHIPNGSVGGQTLERELLGVGASYPGTSPVTGNNAVSIIEGYANSRALPNIADPNVPGDMFDADGNFPENWMTALFNDGLEQDSEVILDISSYDKPPYPFENGDPVIDPSTGLPIVGTFYPGGENQFPGMYPHSTIDYTGNNLSNKLTVAGGNFPCGLIRFQNQLRAEAADGSTVVKPCILEIDLVPGTHRGYLAESMSEM